MKETEYVEGVEEEIEPPDGGLLSWLVVMASFLVNGIVFGSMNSYSLLHEHLSNDLRKNGDRKANSKSALVGALTMGTTFFASSVAGMMTDTIGLQTTSFIGSFLAAGGLLLSSFFTHIVEALYFTYGIMFGLGSALTYTPSLVILGHYFKKYIGVVNGIVTFGSSVFTVIMPYLIDALLKNYQIDWTLRILACIAALMVGCSFLFRPVNKAVKKKKIKAKDVINISIWKNKRYVIWASVVAFSLSGYFVPYVHMQRFVKDNFPSDVDGKIPVISIGITSGIGRLLFGYIADFPKVNSIYLQQLSLLVIGSMTLLLPSTGGSFTLLIIASLAFGLFDGCFVSLMGPIAFEICGQKGATQAIGFVLGLTSIPLTLGPFVAGLLYDHMGSYTLAFRLAGIPPIAGATLLLLIRCVKPPKTIASDPVHQPLQILTSDKGENVKGRLLKCKKVSTVIWISQKDVKKKSRCYSYSIL